MMAEPVMAEHIYLTETPSLSAIEKCRTHYRHTRLSMLTTLVCGHVTFCFMITISRTFLHQNPYAVQPSPIIFFCKLN